MSTPDFVTILTSAGRLLMTKRIALGQDGRPVIREYDNARRFDFATADIASLAELAAVLNRLSPQQCVIRGRLREGIAPRGALRRLYPRDENGKREPATIEPAEHHWLLLDLDSLDCPDGLDPIADPEHGIEHAVRLLPPEFHGASCW